MAMVTQAKFYFVSLILILKIPMALLTKDDENFNMQVTYQ